MKKILKYVACVFIAGSMAAFSFAQSTPATLTATILHLDSLFWRTYNQCDTVGFKEFFTPDVEFYHDKGGVTLGIDSLVLSMKNLCRNPGYRLRREAVEGTIHVYPMAKNGVIYGAIISGEHVFYILEKDKPERLDGHAIFTHLWLLKNNQWKMARVLSYSHGPAKYVNKRETVHVDGAVLEQLAGIYLAPKTGKVVVETSTDGLLLLIGDKKMLLYPSASNLFFSKERDLTFEFVRKDDNSVDKIRVRENGSMMEEAVRQQK
jgi:hypothetical protein